MALADDISAQNLGKPIEVEDPSNPDQCMDWAFYACDRMGIPREAIRHLFAYQAFTQPNDVTRQYFDIVPNTPSYVPPANALAIWGTGVGVAGHIAWVRSGSTQSVLRTSDQNWNYKPYIQNVDHNYNSVIGFLVPKTNNSNQGATIMNHDDGVELYRTGLFREPESPNVADQWNGLSPRDAMKRLKGSEEWQSYSKKVHDYDNQVKKVADLTKQVADLQKQVSTGGGIDQATKDQIANTNSIVQWIKDHWPFK